LYALPIKHTERFLDKNCPHVFMLKDNVKAIWAKEKRENRLAVLSLLLMSKTEINYWQRKRLLWCLATI
jgi:hypothetical protein